MSSTLAVPKLNIITDNKFTPKEIAFIFTYLANGGNASQAVIEAGYKTKAPSRYAIHKSLLSRREKEGEMK